MKPKEDGVEDYCFCNTAVKCVQTPDSGKFKGKLQWQNIKGKFQGKSHYNWDFKTQKISCRGVCEVCGYEQTVDSKDDASKNSWDAHCSGHESGGNNTPPPPTTEKTSEHKEEAAATVEDQHKQDDDEWMKKRQKEIQGTAAKVVTLDDFDDDDTNSVLLGLTNKTIKSMTDTNTEILQLITLQVQDTLKRLEGQEPYGGKVGMFTEIIYRQFIEEKVRGQNG